MAVMIQCPECARESRVSERFLGKQGRCPGCGAVFRIGGAAEPEGPGPLTTTAAPPAAPFDDPYRAPDESVGRRDPTPFKFHLRVKHDPSGALKGVYPVEPHRGGLRLFRKKAEVARVAVGSRARYLGKTAFTVRLNGSEVTFLATQFNLYNARLAEDVVHFLNREIRELDADDYTMPKGLVVAALLPAGVGFVSMAGGAIGGAIGGGLTGLLLMANFALCRRERWPLAARISACLGVSAFGYFVLIAAIVGIVKLAALADGNVPPPVAYTPSLPTTPKPPAPHRVTQETDWGDAEDPDGDCQVRVDGDSAEIDVPGTTHELSTSTGLMNAPRITRAVLGDFVAVVKVRIGAPPAGPPAPGSHLAFNGAGLVLWEGPHNFIRLERAAFRRGDHLQTYALCEHQQGAGLLNSQSQNVDSEPTFLKLEGRGGMVRGATSRDGLRWEWFPAIPFGSVNARVGVEAVNTASTPFRPRFEQFRVEAP